MEGGPLNIERWDFRLSEAREEDGLSGAEVARADRIPDPARRRAYVRSRTLLRKVLARRLRIAPEAVAIAVGGEGKPRLERAEPVGFSISHSGDWFVVAVGDAEIGVDIETQLPRLDPLRMARRFFSADDVHALEAAGDSERRECFRWQWVAKEAAVKACGLGLANLLDRAVCRYREGTIHRVEWPGRGFSVRVFTLADGTPGAVAAEGETTIEFREYSRTDLIS
jgi:phosphopantetheinyl transferase